ncbi:DNA-directed RNA polymerase subunit omega [Ammoniphilus sp. CFH 90114]|uniref:DNA-directed RNA polymerase subunit omega n=1 Tax=Ammoniphilus sp. CFH 90114 TaxID=2493665 RepID=UPI00100DBEF9|nr:DNA-directed RNA polymerase subunit omega [Ammoniphilus sp. CFH 90114]RXT15043.1 DNA-directed RNA polymerase subunit omega [Ammoniphilus sp. CFH 90114]
MIYPSIDKLVDKVESKYTLVSLASKRARQLRENEKDIKVDKPHSKKYVGIALEEIVETKLAFERPKTVDR